MANNFNFPNYSFFLIFDSSEIVYKKYSTRLDDGKAFMASLMVTWQGMIFYQSRRIPRLIGR